jgi:DNA topoisomerase-2
MNHSNKYQLLDERSRVMVNSTMYLGSNIRTSYVDYYITNSKLTKIDLNIHYLIRKMLDEILINVTDHSSTEEGKHLSQMKVEIGKNYISVYDNGGIPVIKHSILDMYIPYLIFGNLGGGSKTGYDKDSARGGQNKIGASLVNILSSKFIIETSDGKNSYYQEFTKNMGEYSIPIIKKCRKKFTKITFYPDFPTIKYTNNNDEIVNEFIEDDIIAFETRVHEIAICNPKLVVSLNGKKININSMKKYAMMLSNDTVCISNNNWDLCVIPSKDREFDAISFINSIRTHDLRSTHVSYVADKMVSEIRSFIYKKHKIDIKPSDVKNSMCILLSSKIKEPKFDSQVKEYLTTPVSSYDKVIKIDDKFIRTLIKSEVVSNLVEWAKNKSIKLKDKKLKEREANALANDPKFVPKFSDATNKNRELCRLFLTEGDSANKSVVSARNTKLDGSFPLKGVPLNVRGVKIDKVIKNIELFNIITVTGLKIGMSQFTKPDGIWYKVKIDNNTFMMNEHDKYTTTNNIIRRASKRYIQEVINDITPYIEEYRNNSRIRRSLVDGLRFNEIVLTPDADFDGYKIAALHINNFSLLWPDFIKEGRLKLLRTPIIRITKGPKTYEFYNKEEFSIWQKDNSLTGFKVNYIKGLSGHSESQFKSYINNPKNFYTITPDDNSDDLLNQIFSTSTAKLRKEWLK